jgi:hypothetical protein
MMPVLLRICPATAVFDRIFSSRPVIRYQLCLFPPVPTGCLPDRCLLDFEVSCYLARDSSVFGLMV